MKQIGFLLILSMFSFKSFSKDQYDESISEYKKLLSYKFALIPHKGTYFLPFSYNENPNPEVPDSIISETLQSERGSYYKKLETEFQISFLILTNENFLNTGYDTFIGYTHHSWWQLYNSEWSRPFRETNYEPEFFARKMPNRQYKIFGLSLLNLDFGFVHQSNGQIQELSRSWNRIFTSVVSGRLCPVNF